MKGLPARLFAVLLAIALISAGLAGCAVRTKDSGQISDLEDSLKNLNEKVEGIAGQQSESHQLSSEALDLLTKLNADVNRLVSTAPSPAPYQSGYFGSYSYGSSYSYTPAVGASSGVIPADVITRLRSQLSMPVLLPSYLPANVSFVTGPSIKTSSPQSYSMIFSRSLNFRGTNDPTFDSRETNNRQNEKSFKIGIFDARSYIDPDTGRYMVVVTYAGNHYVLDGLPAQVPKSEIDRIAQSIHLPR